MAKKPTTTITATATKKATSVNNVKDQTTPPMIVLKNTIDHQVQVARIRQNIQAWRLAVTAAENPYNPQRYNLLQTYMDVVIDAHVSACLMQRKNMVMGLEFEVIKGDQRNEELSKMCNKKWFSDFISLAFDSVPYGFSLVQFDTLINDEFKIVELVDRIFVKPEFGIVVKHYGDNTGVPFNEPPYSDWCIGVGEKKDLGLLMKVAPLAIWKKNALAAWADFQEIFGSPLRIGKTNLKDGETADNMEKMLKNMGVAAYGMFDTDDVIELVETKRSDAYQVFDQMLVRCNSEISKLILGQTGTMDEKSFVGSAEVHERILQMGLKADKRLILNVLNKQLIPMLEGLGFVFGDFKFNVVKEDALTLEEKAKIDIEFLKTGLFTMDPKVIKEKYGSELIPVVQNTVDPEATKKVNEKLKNIYSS